METPAHQSPAPVAKSLFVLSLFYGGMVTIAGVLGAKQIALGPLAVEAGIFPFLTLVAISSGIAELHGKRTADQLVRYGMVLLVMTIAMTLMVLKLPADRDMYEPAKEAFPIILGQSWRMMLAGIIAYGISVSLNIWIFSRLRPSAAQPAGVGRAGLRGFIAAAISQIIDTLLFITISFYGVRPIADLMLGQMLSKVVLSALVVPVIIWIVLRIGRRLDGQAG